MSIFNALVRTITSPIEVSVRTISGVLDFSHDNIDNPGTAIDVVTMGVSRVIRKGASAISKTAEGILDEF